VIFDTECARVLSGVQSSSTKARIQMFVENNGKQQNHLYAIMDYFKQSYRGCF